MTDDGGLPIPRQRHAHLRLGKVITPGRRQGRKGFGGAVKHKDRSRHANAIRERTVAVVDAFKRRPPVLGVDPELVVVLETNRRLEPAEVEAAGLQVLEIRGIDTLVAFSSDSDMGTFLAQNAEYAAGVRGVTEKGNERAALYQSLFDSLEDVRSLAPDDIISVRVARHVRESSPTDVIRLDIQCWCPEVREDAARRQDETRKAIEAAQGRILDSSLRVEAGLSVICAELPAGAVVKIAVTDRVRRIDTLPQPSLAYSEVFRVRFDELPLVLPPAASAPVVGVIDSGIRDAHPLLAPAVIEVDYVDASLGDGSDQNGHGTLVASLALYGSLEEHLLAPGSTVQPVARLVSIRVLDGDNLFPRDRVWESQLIQAMQMAVDAGARVLNLSVGDIRNPYSPPRPTALAALVDQFSRANNVVIVMSAGNYIDIEFETTALVTGEYPKVLLESGSAGLADPASAALAITVGALCSGTRQGADLPVDANRVPAGAEGMPSPYTRVGPGIGNMVKPEVAAPGGSLSVDTLMNYPVRNDRRVQIVGAGGETYDRLLATASGTSFAAPLVSNAALRVWAQYPELSANAVRALILSSIGGVDQVIEGGKPSEDRDSQRRLTGYGRIDAERAETSDDHRVVLLSESAIELDDVHMYSVTLPSSFFASGGVFTVSVAMTYDPPVRPTRLEYMASRMSVFAFFGADHEQVRAEFVRNPPTEASDNADADADADDAVPAALVRFRLNLQPSDTVRGRGTNHYGQYVRKQRFDADRGRDLVVAVRNTNKWDTPGAHQSYALAVTLERDDQHPPIYAELRAQLRAVTELEVEI